MVNSGLRDSGNSQFFICISGDSMEHLDGKYVVFGRIKGGKELLKEIAYYGDAETGIPKAEIVIADCGI